MRTKIYSISDSDLETQNKDQALETSKQVSNATDIGSKSSKVNHVAEDRSSYTTSERAAEIPKTL